MTRTVNRITAIFLFVFILFAATAFPAMRSANAEATVIIEEPFENNPYTTDGSYIAYGSGAGGIEVPIKLDCYRPSDRKANECKIWLRFRHDGKTLKFYNIKQTGISSTFRYTGGQTFQPIIYGKITMEVWIDWPPFITGTTQPIYTQMSESNFVPEASATFTVTHDHTGKFGYDVPWEDDYTVDKEPTCTEPGSESIHCSVCGGSKEGSAREIPALNHKWGTPSYTWASDNSSVTANAACINDSSHKESETVKTTYKVTVEPTVTSEGKGTYTATFTKAMFTTQTKEVAIPKLEGSSGGDSGDGSGGSAPGTGSNPGTGSEPGNDPGAAPGSEPGQQPGSDGQSGPEEQVTLKKIKISKVTAVSKKKVKVAWKKLSSKVRKKAKMIEVQISTDKSFAEILQTKTLKSSKTSCTFSGLQKNTKYYVRIRVFTEEGNIKYVSPWSSVKKIKTKKK